MAEVVVLSGGVGGARFVRGLVDLVGPGERDGDRERRRRRRGLRAARLARPRQPRSTRSPASTTSSAAGAAAGETWNALETAKALGDDETWFQLGDRDLGLHLVRTKALRAGEPLSAVTARVAAAFGVEVRVLPGDRRPAAHDRRDARPARSRSRSGSSAAGHEDEVDGLRFEGAAFAKPAPGVLEAIEQASLVVIAPSNPYISIWPILAVRRDPRTRPAEAHARGRRQPARSAARR